MRLLDRLEETLIAALIAAATLLIFVAVMHRYSIGGIGAAIAYARVHDHPAILAAAKWAFGILHNVNLTWAQELTIFMFVWMAKFGAAYGVRTGIHVGVDVLINRLSSARRRPIIIFSLLAGAFFTGVVGSLGATLVWRIAHTDQVSADLELPMWIVYLAVPLGSYLMSFRFLQVAWSFARTDALPHHDQAHVEGLEEQPV